MKRIWILSGRLLFWTAWPALFVWLYFTTRTRVLVIVGDQILIVKGWLSSGKWGLPGGGVHIGEDPEVAALRELREETGITVKKGKLRFLRKAAAKDDHRLKYQYHAFSLELPKKPPLKRQLELTHLEWRKWKDIYNDPNASKDIKDILTAWQAKR